LNPDITTFLLIVQTLLEEIWIGDSGKYSLEIRGERVQVIKRSTMLCSKFFGQVTVQQWMMRV
jgi:hypothetical protein